MLPQLVGMACAVCSQRIGSEIDGRFCEVCGNPVHNRCSKCPSGPASNDDVLSVTEEKNCPRCGADPKAPLAVAMRCLTIRSRVAAEATPFRHAAESNHYWKQLAGIGVLLGVMMLLLSAAGLVTSDNPETRVIAPMGIGFGFVLIAVGALAAWLQTCAARRYQAASKEQEEPPG